LCATVIDTQQYEYELAGYGGARFRFHMRCHAIWQLAVSERLAESPENRTESH